MLLTKQKLFTEKGEPENPSAIVSIDKFITWRNSKSEDDFIQIVRRGILNRKSISSQIQEEQETKFPKSHLNDNKWVSHLLNNLESHLRKQGVLPALTKEAEIEEAKGTKDNPKIYDKNQHKAIQEAKLLSELQELTLRQQARIKELESQLEEYSTKENIYADLAEMGAEFGQ